LNNSAISQAPCGEDFAYQSPRNQ